MSRLLHCSLYPDHALGHDIAREQKTAEGDDHQRGPGLDTAHRQHAVPGAAVGEAFGPGPGAPTAIIAMMATVMAAPTPITRVATTPAQNSPCARAKTSTRIAPEQGRRPTA